jgi:two-component system, chemotaxis family, chemotaxis protein CheY
MGSPKTIMTVDDAVTIRKMISMTLKGAGHEVMEAVDGAAALDALKDRPVDLIISDVNMPNMDGIEMTRQLRQTSTHNRTPIILLTTESAQEIKDKGRAAGATGWIVKPFKQEQLLAVLAKLFP